MNASQQGRRNRRAGNTWEQDVARYLTDQLGIHITSARDVAMGRQLGVDLVEKTDHEILFTVHGWSLEAKYATQKIDGRTVERMRPAPWLEQARKQADSNLHAVIAKRHRKPVEDGLVFMPRSGLVWWLRAESVDDDTPVCMSLGAFVELLVWEPRERADAA